jgi:hypothetical protein
MNEFTNAGNAIGGFLGGVFNPIAGQTTTTTVTEDKGSGSNTAIIVVAVVVLIVIGYFVFKPKKVVA